MSLACICKHVTSLYFDGFCYSVVYIYIRDLHAIFFNLKLSRNHSLEDHSGNKYCNTFLCYPRFESRNACLLFYTFNNDM